MNKKIEKKTELATSKQNPNILNILWLCKITKTFLSYKIIANNNVSISFQKGHIHAIVIENGSGKSTLMNIIFGLYKQDVGDIFINEKLVNMCQSGQPQIISHLKRIWGS